MITQSYLKETFEYRDGQLYYKTDLPRKKCKGMRAGCSATYHHICVLGRQTYEHRLVWIMHHGAIPDNLQVDHIDNNKLNNRIENLRLATKAQNQYNRPTRAKVSGLKGVYYSKRDNKWFSTINVNGKSRRLGSFETKEAAYNRYKIEADKIYGEFAKY
jgi:hypothetical protein